MKGVFSYMAAAAAVLMLSACQKTKVDQDFLNDNKLRLVENGRTIHSFNPLTWQVAYSEDKMEFRVFNDTMSDYYVLTCQELPTFVGQEIKASLKWSGATISSRNNITFRVEKTDPRGRIWLWSKKSKIAVSVMAL